MRALLVLGSAVAGVDGQDFFLGASKLQQKKPSYPKPDYPTPGSDQPGAPPQGAQFARATKALPDAACPPPTGWPMPPDGLGIGPVLVNNSKRGLPQKSQSCGNCGPKCKKIQDAFAHAFDMYSKGDHGATLNNFVHPNAYFTTTGYGATSHACHGHTFFGTAEVSGEINKCYSFEARIGTFFWPTALDIMVSNCGDKAVLQMGCVNCTNDAGYNYPQRYSWVVQIQEAPHLEAGFQFYRNHGLLDSELTLGMTIEEFSYDPYVCPYLENPLHPFPPLPKPHSYDVPTNVPVLEKVNCEECPKCDSRYATIEGAWNQTLAGNWTTGIFDLLADDVIFDIVGDGPTQAACFGHVYEGKDEVLNGKRSPIKRLQAMLTSTELLSTDLLIDSCGTKFNAFYIFYLNGKSGFQYTMNVDVAFYLDDKENENGFTVSYVRVVPDTEVLMNLAEREQAHDSYKCDKLGEWSWAVSHTILQP